MRPSRPWNIPSSLPSVGAMPSSSSDMATYLRSKYNLNDAQIGGLLGNAMGESSMNPNAQNAGHTGLFQWDSSRYRALQGQGFDLSSVNGQLDAYLHELKTTESTNGGNRFFGATDLATAVKAVFDTERPGDNSLGRRMAYGQQIAGGQSIGGGIDPDLAQRIRASLTRNSGVSALDRGYYDGALGSGQRDLEAQQTLLDATAKSFGATAEAAAKYGYEAKVIADLQRAGVHVTDSFRQVLSAQGDQYSDLAKKTLAQQEAQQKLVNSMDGVRSVASSGLGTFVNDLAAGKKGTEALRDSLKSMTQQIGQMAEHSLLGALMGKQGTPGLGLFGSGANGSGLVGSLFSMFGLGGGAAAPIADTGLAFAGMFDSGGYTGAGGRLEPAGVVHRGEYVFNADSVNRIGVGNLERLHKGYAEGGHVGALPYFMRNPRAANGTVAPSTPTVVQPVVNVTNAPSTPTVTTGKDGSVNIDFAVNAISKKQMQNVSRGRGPQASLLSNAGLRAG